MHAIRWVAFAGLAFIAQSAVANTVWLKAGGAVCTNTQSTNPGQVIGYGGVDGNGVFTLTISNPTDGTITRGCTNLPTTGTSTAQTPITFNGSVQAQTPNIDMIKAGTKGVAECLRQGQNLSGVSVTNLSDTSNQYTLSMTFSFTDGCDPVTGQRLTPSGLPDFIRDATLHKPTGTDFSGQYYVFNANAVPEPDTLLLVAAGFAALGLAGTRRFPKGRRRAA